MHMLLYEANVAAMLAPLIRGECMPVVTLDHDGDVLTPVSSSNTTTTTATVAINTRTSSAVVSHDMISNNGANMDRDSDDTVLSHQIGYDIETQRHACLALAQLAAHPLHHRYVHVHMCMDMCVHVYVYTCMCMSYVSLV